MEFDITDLDKLKLIKSLYRYAMPAGVGIAEFAVRDARGEDVSEMPDSDCREALDKFNKISNGDCLKIFDYYNGKPLKLVFNKSTNGRITVDTTSYDYRNGKYKSLEAMMDNFSLEDIKIIVKSYKKEDIDTMPEELLGTKERNEYFCGLLKNAIQQEYEHGKYYSIKP